MSGTRVTTTRPPLIAPRSEAEAEHADDDDDAELLALALHQRRPTTTLVSAIIEPIERSIPPEITMIAWATAARASGSTDDREALDAGQRRSSAG